MPNELFHRLFPDVAAKEVRTLYLRGGKRDDLPDDDYAFIESYCTEPGCDCRRVLLHVTGAASGIVATISLGFDPNGKMPGPFLDPICRQGPHAEEILEMARQLVFDPEYLARLERHYRMVKDAEGGHASTGPWWKRKPKKRKRR